MNTDAIKPRRSFLGTLLRLPYLPFIWLFNLLIFGSERNHPKVSTGYGSNAEWAIHQAEARGARVLLWTSLLVVGGLLVWAYFGFIDEVVRGDGKVVPSRQVQVVQSLDGGSVKEILVRPGQQVEAGQVLLRIDPTRFNSSLGENNAEYYSLLAKAARLHALATGDVFQAPAEVLAKLPAAAESERNAWIQRTNELNATVAVAKEQVKQRQEELRETETKRDQAATTCSLTSREMAVTRPLLKSGAVSEVDLLRLQRDVTKSCGDAKGAEASIDRIQASIKEAQSKVQEAELNIRNQARSELMDTNTKLATLHAGQVALADKVKLSEIRSPVRGTVKTLLNNTVGGVVQPGKDILEIVPTDDTLLLEVRINPRDVGFLHPQQKAEVKFTAYDYSIYGGLEGQVESIGADTITDERGNSFYIVRVRTAQSSLGNGTMPIIPGMVAEVHILTGKRTVLQYLLKPILRAKSNAFTER
ncbi:MULTISPECIES: HlyD family type I secretion periplasmic adaptor subunit [unclassified Achromobacter]|uniref:HlyD family type I secretion periplasmic adaptor subunit n=1 Tax=unclassified Achromobacter TaxID=2626865 RepID=UPI000B515761|nr:MULTISPECIES: HlyD family type I secretion periplasmic adaptor subunit [unclassified Achromobacter]OWT79861.1 secretion protein HylD [Achromobacter sp. HZ34]OWT81745.1 secretion protein HylD [Achromobacter sp. HZ28]